MVTKLKNSKCDISQKLQMWQNSSCDTTQIVTKLKLWWNSNGDKTQNVGGKNQKLKCDKTQIVTKLENLNDKTQKLKFWQNIQKKTEIGTKLEIWQISIYEEHCDTLTTNAMFSGQRFAILAMFS